MDRKTALEVKTSLIEYARKHGLWVDIRETRTPELKDIVVTISVRVTEPK